MAHDLNNVYNHLIIKFFMAYKLKNKILMINISGKFDKLLAMKCIMDCINIIMT